jgi:Flp pilus assembly protein TadB
MERSKNMEWLQVLTVIGANAGLFFWARSESRSDWRKSDEENRQVRRDLVDVMRSIDQEIKDFHGRLCSLEEKNRSKK